MMNENYTIAEEYTLPSNGLIYDQPVESTVKLRSMTIQEEMRRQSGGTATHASLCEIIDRCIVNNIGISVYDMAFPDYEFLLHKLRVVSYGQAYKMVVGCPHCGKKQIYVANLDDLKVVTVNPEEYRKLLEVKLPRSGEVVKLKIPTPRLEDKIQNKLREFNKNNMDYQGDMTPIFTIETLIDTVDGVKMSFVELEKLVKTMQIADYNTIIKTIEKINGAFGLDKKIEIQCNSPKCGKEFLTFFRLTSEFFGPSID